MSTGTLDIMLSLCAKACIAKDQGAAKKWLAQLNTLAPESPQAGKARKLYNTTFEKK
jgi:hypothetical protein